VGLQSGIPNRNVLGVKDTRSRASMPLAQSGKSLVCSDAVRRFRGESVSLLYPNGTAEARPERSRRDSRAMQGQDALATGNALAGTLRTRQRIRGGGWGQAETIVKRLRLRGSLRLASEVFAGKPVDPVIRFAMEMGNGKGDDQPHGPTRSWRLGGIERSFPSILSEDVVRRDGRGLAGSVGAESVAYFLASYVVDGFVRSIKAGKEAICKVRPLNE
jgi:hypothetical protein